MAVRNQEKKIQTSICVFTGGLVVADVIEIKNYLFIVEHRDAGNCDMHILTIIDYFIASIHEMQTVAKSNTKN